MALVSPERATIVDRAWDAQSRIESRVGNLGKGKYGRVLKMARKPTPEEYEKVAKVTAIGLVLLGAIGFAIYFAMRWVPGGSG
ncbi:MAG TPA: protein translocase SEC61 complex subunit gamma [Candidatus Thermoplasmatota archaeon]|nr:protein translocase SEC61 complex subunit gamma [Candidatus Thermoplasmatota archaeon]